MHKVYVLALLALTACALPDGEGEGPEDKDCDQVCKDMPDMCKSCRQVPDNPADGVSPEPLPWK